MPTLKPNKPNIMSTTPIATADAAAAPAASNALLLLEMVGDYEMHFLRLSLTDSKTTWNLYPFILAGLTQLTGQQHCCFAQISLLWFVKGNENSMQHKTKQRGQNCTGIASECHW
jgi:hypothetical protein